MSRGFNIRSATLYETQSRKAMARLAKTVGMDLQKTASKVAQEAGFGGVTSAADEWLNDPKYERVLFRDFLKEKIKDKKDGVVPTELTEEGKGQKPLKSRLSELPPAVRSKWQAAETRKSDYDLTNEVSDVVVGAIAKQWTPEQIKAYGGIEKVNATVRKSVENAIKLGAADELSDGRNLTERLELDLADVAVGPSGAGFPAMPNLKLPKNLWGERKGFGAAESGKPLPNGYKKPSVSMNIDGNAFSVMGAVSRALKNAGHKDLVADYIKEATSGDYDNLLRASMKYVNFGGSGGSRVSQDYLDEADQEEEDRYKE